MELRKSAEWVAVGGLSDPSKMPGWAYGIPARACKVGGKLARVANSVCEKCYARRGRYVFGNVKAAQERRLLALNDPKWAQNMITLIKRVKEKHFRWHDSGDLQSLKHLKDIVYIAEKCPDVQFRLPTKEVALVREYMQHDIVPDNLCISVSAPMMDQRIPSLGYQTSMVVSNGSPIPKDVFECPATMPDGDHRCGDCRACWDNNVTCVAYHKH